MTMRAALYSRYSSDQQRAASIEDQFRVCREHAEREGWKIGGCYRDAAISGDSVILRPAVQALLEDARRGVSDVVVAEALDRVSRDQVDVAVLYKHLRFAGVTVVTLAEGEISELHVGVKGTMNALFLKDLAAKTCCFSNYLGRNRANCPRLFRARTVGLIRESVIRILLQAGHLSRRLSASRMPYARCPLSLSPGTVAKPCAFTRHRARDNTIRQLRSIARNAHGMFWEKRAEIK